MSTAAEMKIRAQLIFEEYSELTFWLWTAYGPRDWGAPPPSAENTLPLHIYIAIASAPGPVKDALALGCVTGVLEDDGPSLVGDLALTELGAMVLEKLSQAMRKQE